MSRPVLHDAFTEPPVSVTYNKEFTNRGVVNCYETSHPPKKAAPFGDEEGRLNPNYKGEVYLLSGNPVSIDSFTPNEVLLTAQAAPNDRIVLNQNFLKGWKAEIQSHDSIKREVLPYNGLVSVLLQPGESKVSLHYSPSSFKVGLLISALSFCLAGVYLSLGLRRKECIKWYKKSIRST